MTPMMSNGGRTCLSKLLKYHCLVYISKIYIIQFTYLNRSEDLSHGSTNCCNFCCAIIKTSIDYWQINDKNRRFHSWNQTFTQMKLTTLTYQIKHFHPLNQSLSSKLTIYLVALVWILRDLANCLRQYKSLSNFTWRRKAWIFKTEAPLPRTQGLLMRFGTMDTMPNRLGEKE
jgi:hypothetical protein